MAKFITIGYGDREGYERTDAAVRDAAHAHDARLRKAGTLMGVAGTPVQVRNAEAKKIETASGSFMSSSLPVAGFAVIEAATLADAVNWYRKPPVRLRTGWSRCGRSIDRHGPEGELGDVLPLFSSGVDEVLT
jgi:hypothetical protein